MLKFIKHIASLFLFFVAYQIISGFLMVGPSLQAIPEFPAQLIENMIWICAIIVLVLSIALIILLWKYIYPRHSVDYRVTASWFHKIQWPILLYIAFFIIQFIVPVPESENQKLVIEFVSAYPLIAFSSVVIFAPILEELIFRGFFATYFFPKMADMKAVGIYLLVTGSLFSLVHMPATLPQFLIYFTMGLNLGWLYLIKRDIRYPIALHMLNNGISYLMIVFLV
ncbi:CPBP family intramembrane metalloprotease [Streptococcus suis]|uniref:CPBP family intramembrane glutamic endopeptidase n=1 Tax=Streptococcus suis TaxID=1307 RepID=UPI0005CC9790|nr:type II CAAX endopeptidase family protein [Streptococcus suis]MCK3948917.1 CPBP family intramembrane metalloprotease [Streptococcus suis]MCK3962233.1 CPBP family intramembrane metalloprotease [Streptococcus suis]MCK3989929.1 CPBP family intramembrane metalloprotease [Streptococcus suis]MDE1695204.1 type II CAAX endopeptidase family protein [Streptococcus suis]MEE3813923.1 type II CAAX endopeptidase family protein [Streptococcus suis]